MPRVFGKFRSRAELERLLGDMSQLAGVRPVELTDGPERGARALLVWTGSGLEFTVLVERGLDIGATRFRGVPLAWRSPVGDAHPAYYEPQGTGWLRTFYGGLLVTCGLDNVGVPAREGKEAFGLHGRYSHLPARNVCWGAEWQNENYVLWIRGEVRQWRMFGENLLVERSIRTALGASEIIVEDRITNEGAEPVPLMLLYHVNLGWPLLDPETRIEAPAKRVQPRDARAAEGLKTWSKFASPRAGYEEQVFYLDLDSTDAGVVEVRLENPILDGGLAFVVRYREEQLPHFILWKMLAPKNYVVGFEPANCLVEGRAVERGRGTLQQLEPGETAVFQVALAVETARQG